MTIESIGRQSGGDGPVKFFKCAGYIGGLIMKVEYLVWTGKEKFKVMYDEGKALKYAARVKAGEVEKCTITTGGLSVDSEVIWKYTGPRP